MQLSDSKEDKMLLARLEDKALQSRDRNICTHGSFLDSRQAALAAQQSRSLGVPLLLWGGYEGAERCVPFFLPEYMQPEDAKEQAPLQLLRAELPKGAKQLTHRDYLGSLLALGIRRELTGDILVNENGADILILEEIGAFLLSSYTKAGRMNLQCSLLPLSALEGAEQRTEDIRDTVASLRLDALVSSAFRLSRGNAQEGIAQGLVAVNGLQCLKPDFQPKEGDRLSFRGRGKAVLAEVGQQSRKGRLFVLIKRFL